MSAPSPLHIGCCISAHGFGHAARTMAVMETLANLADIDLTIITTVPEWFIRSSYSGRFSFHPLQTDVGLVQKSPLAQDIPATIRSLERYYPVRPERISTLAAILARCTMVVCDISPAGIVAAREAGIPSILVENFTWDWILEEYLEAWPDLQPFIGYFREVNAMADYRVQTMPVCREVNADLSVPPVARGFRENGAQIRRRLQVAEGRKLVLVSMGGVGLEQLPLGKFAAAEDVSFAVTGYTGEKVQVPNVKFLPPQSDFFHPDLVRASDAVIGKAGYSTIAEVYHADVPFGFVPRPDFRESGPLVSFIREEMSGLEIPPGDFWNGAWLAMLPALFRLKKKGQPRLNGASRCAQFFLELRGGLQE